MKLFETNPRHLCLIKAHYISLKLIIIINFKKVPFLKILN